MLDSRLKGDWGGGVAWLRQEPAELARMLGEEMAGIHTELTALRDEVTGLRAEVAPLKEALEGHPPADQARPEPLTDELAAEVARTQERLAAAERTSRSVQAHLALHAEAIDDLSRRVGELERSRLAERSGEPARSDPTARLQTPMLRLALAVVTLLTTGSALAVLARLV